MADVKPTETAPHAPAPAKAPPPPPPPDPRDLAIRAAIAGLERMVADAAVRGDHATLEAARNIAILLDAALAAART